MTTPLVPHRWARLYAPGQAAGLAVEDLHALSLFRAAATRASTAPVIHYFDRSLSCAEIDALSDALASALLARGVQRGDRVALYLQNVPQFVIGLVASRKAGAIAVSINPMNREREVSLLLADAMPAAIIAHESGYTEVLTKLLPAQPVATVITTCELEFQTRDDARLFAASRRNRPVTTLDFLDLLDQHRGVKPPPFDFVAADIAMLVYTSGTTGLPKGVMNTHGNVAFYRLVSSTNPSRESCVGR